MDGGSNFRDVDGIREYINKDLGPILLKGLTEISY